MTTKLQLSIFLKEAEMSGEVALHEAIVRRLLHLEIKGATVLRGWMGYGRHGHLHHKRLLGISDDRPIVILAIDDPEKIHGVLPELRLLAPNSLITLQEVSVV